MDKNKLLQIFYLSLPFWKSLEFLYIECENFFRIQDIKNGVNIICAYSLLPFYFIGAFIPSNKLIHQKFWCFETFRFLVLYAILNCCGYKSFNYAVKIIYCIHEFKENSQASVFKSVFKMYQMYRDAKYSVFVRSHSWTIPKQFCSLIICLFLKNPFILL